MDQGLQCVGSQTWDGWEVYGDASQFKIANALIQDNTSEERGDREEDPTSEDWREKILLNANPQWLQEEIITNTEEMVETSNSDKMEQNKAQEFPAAVTRPRRDRMRPEYLKDYITLPVVSVRLPDIDIYIPWNIFVFKLRTLDI